jgi:hypothetical protein
MEGIKSLAASVVGPKDRIPHPATTNTMVPLANSIEDFIGILVTLVVGDL